LSGTDCPENTDDDGGNPAVTEFMTRNLLVYQKNFSASVFRCQALKPEQTGMPEIFRSPKAEKFV